MGYRGPRIERTAARDVLEEMEDHAKPPKRKRRKRQKHNAAARLKQETQQQLPNKKLTLDKADDGVKMSEVLKAFVAPFRHLAETKDAFQRLLAIAVAPHLIVEKP
jgi:hypothetical protein